METQGAEGYRAGERRAQMPYSGKPTGEICLNGANLLPFRGPGGRHGFHVDAPRAVADPGNRWDHFFCATNAGEASACAVEKALLMRAESPDAHAAKKERPKTSSGGAVPPQSLSLAALCLVSLSCLLQTHFLRPGLFKCAMKAADLAVRRPPRPPRPRFILALFRTIFTLAALAICQSTSPSSLSPSQTRTSAFSHRINAFDYHVLLLNETALAATLSLYQSIDRPPTAMHRASASQYNPVQFSPLHGTPRYVLRTYPGGGRRGASSGTRRRGWRRKHKVHSRGGKASSGWPHRSDGGLSAGPRSKSRNRPRRRRAARRWHSSSRRSRQ